MSSSRSRRQVRRLHLDTPYVRQPSVHNALRADRKLIRAAWKRRPAPWITVDVRPHLEAFAQMMLAFSKVTETFSQSAAALANMGEQLAREREERAATARTAVAAAFPPIRGQQCTLSIVDETRVLVQSAVEPERLAPADESALIARINALTDRRIQIAQHGCAPVPVTWSLGAGEYRTASELAELRRQYFEGGQTFEESTAGAEYSAHVRAARDRIQAAQRSYLQQLVSRLSASAERVYNPLDARTWDPSSGAKQWQGDLALALGYVPNPATNLWDIAPGGVQVIDDLRMAVITEVIVDDAGMAVWDEGRQRVREVWLDLPEGWTR